MKLILASVAISLLVFSPQSAAIQCDNPPQFGQRTLKKEIIDYILTQIGITKPWCISENHKMSSMYNEDSSFVTYGEPFVRPAVPTTNFWGLSYDEAFTESCLHSSRFRRMPIVSPPQSVIRWLPRYNLPAVSINKYIAYEGVPFKVKVHDRGWATKLISPSYYHWDFGDGSRAYPKDDDKHTVTHTYDTRGVYSLNSVVMTKFGEVGVTIGGDFGGDAFSWSTPAPYYKSTGVGIDGCDIAQVEVVKNNPPVASFIWGSSGSGTGVTLSFDGSNSTDPDGNEILSYEWDVGGLKLSGEKQRVKLQRGDYVRYIDATLTVSDGGLESSITRRVMVPPICYSCNNSGKHEP